MEKEGLNFKLSEKKILIYVENPGESNEKPLWLVGEFSKGGAKLIYQSQSFMVTCNNWLEKIIEGIRMNHFFPRMLVSLMIIILIPGGFLWLKCYLLTYLAVPCLLPWGVLDALSDSDNVTTSLKPSLTLCLVSLLSALAFISTLHSHSAYHTVP